MTPKQALQEGDLALAVGLTRAGSRPAAAAGPRKCPYMYCSVRCDKCDKTIGAHLGHYDIVACGRCGKEYWALEPRRDHPLKLYPYPGTWLDARARAKAAEAVLSDL